MFNFFKKKSLNLIAPISGRTIPLSDIPDPVFSKKTVGDGIAIIPTDDTIVAPADGTLTLVMSSNHAFALTLDSGLEVLVHVGLETESLNGVGFHLLAKVGQRIKAGTPILKFEKKVLELAGFDLTTSILIANMKATKEVIEFVNKDVTAGQDPVIEYKI